MAMNIGKVKQFSKEHPEDVVKDYDKMYDEIKERYSEHIKQGRLGFDDRTKLFHMAVTEGWTEWLIVTYNQCRLGICCGCAGASFGSQQANQAPVQPQGPPSSGPTQGPPAGGQPQGPPSGGGWPTQGPPSSGGWPTQGPPSNGWWPAQQGPPSGGWWPAQQGPPSSGEWPTQQGPPFSGGGWPPQQGPPWGGYGGPPQGPAYAVGGKPSCCSGCASK